jgi:hypothetical protein
MNILKKYWTIIPLFLFGYLFIRSFMISYEEESVFDGLILFFLGISFQTFFIISIYKGIKYFKLKKNKFELMPIFFGFIIIFIFFGFWYKCEKMDISPIILRANYDGDVNGFSLEFREDGTYKFFNYSFFGGKYYRGKYKLRDSILILDKNNIDNVIRTNKLVIRNFNDNIGKKISRIVQIDNKHNRIEEQYFDFIVSEDKR